MARLIHSLTFGKAWDSLLGSLINSEKKVSPRGFPTKEILNVTIEVELGLANILVSDIRKLNYKFMVAEWLWIMAGLEDVHILSKYNSVMKKFSDDGEILSGAYGPRLMPQLPYILNKLQASDTRQAIATIWTPSPTDSKDIPCTISLQWLIREAHLHCTINMRSSDIWLGLPYDFFNFSQITNYIAYWLKLPVGSITMNLASSHLYESNFEVAEKAWGGVVKTAQSPMLEGWMTLEELNHILEHPESSTGPYARVLTGSSQQALEVLIELGNKSFISPI
jgi:thymidylate synthase